MSNRLILLSHPDDEMLCLPFLYDSDAKGAHVDYFLYLTINTLSIARINEARSAVTLLNRELNQSHLVRFNCSLNDGLCWKDFKQEDMESINELLTSLEIDSILTFAYEGGHQDHDMANTIAKALQRNLDVEIVEFSGYRKGRYFPIPVVCKPSFKHSRIRFPRMKVIRIFFKLVKIHKSQIKVWCVLSPPILFRLLRGYTYSTQSSLDSLALGKEKFLYEIRRKASRDTVQNAMLKIGRVVEGGPIND